MTDNLKQVKEQLGDSDSDKQLRAILEICESKDVSDKDILTLLDNFVSLVRKHGQDDAFKIIEDFLDGYDFEKYHKSKESNASQMGDYINNSLNDALNNANIPKIQYDSKTRLSDYIRGFINKVRQCGAVILNDGKEESIDGTDEIVLGELENLQKLQKLIEETKLSLKESLGTHKEKFDLLIKVQ